MDTFNPKKRKIQNFSQFVSSAKKINKAEKGEHETVKDAYSGDKKGAKATEVLDTRVEKKGAHKAVKASMSGGIKGKKALETLDEAELSAAQKKLPPGLQKAILAKKGGKKKTKKKADSDEVTESAKDFPFVIVNKDGKPQEGFATKAEADKEVKKWDTDGDTSEGKPHKVVPQATIKD